MDDPIEPHRRLSDPRELQALAHPVRMGIIELLSIDGPLTATELAERLEESPANCSWHLRKLAEHGFVEEAGDGQGRRRPWRVPGIGFSWNEEDATPEARRAGQALSQVAMSRALDRLRAANERATDEPAEWRRAMNGGEVVCWLTAAELEELNAEMRQLFGRYADRLADPAKRPPGSRLCELVSWGVAVQFPGIEATPAGEEAVR